MSTNFMGQKTDFQRITAGENPLLFLIHSCEHCGFTGDGSAFTGQVDPDVSEQIERLISPHIKDGRVSVDVRWEFAARIAEWRHEAHEMIADLYLNAAWCSEDSAREQYYRRKAADHFEEALETLKENRLAITYLIGELYRRVDEPVIAASWFDRAITMPDNDPDAKQLKELALQQKTDPKDVIWG